MAHHDNVPNVRVSGQASPHEYVAPGDGLSGRPILCVSEDTAYAQQIIIPPLRGAGFCIDLVPADPAGVTRALRDPRALVLFDVCSRAGSIYGTCAQVRRTYQVPIMLILHAAARDEILKGYQCGADICMLAPFDPRELLARLSGLLRRTFPHAVPPELCS